MKHVPYYIFMFGLALMFVWMGFVTYLQYQPFKAPIISKDPMPIVNQNKQVKVGGTLMYELSYCVFEGVKTTNERRISEIGGANRIYFLNSSNSVSKPGCGEVIISLVLSSDIQPGRYKITSVGTYQVNPRRTETKSFESEEFEVVKQ